MNQVETRQVLTQKQAASMLGISPATMQMWRWQNIGPRYLKLGRLVRYRLQDIEAYLASKTKETDY